MKYSPRSQAPRLLHVAAIGVALSLLAALAGLAALLAPQARLLHTALLGLGGGLLLPAAIYPTIVSGLAPPEWRLSTEARLLSLVATLLSTAALALALLGLEWRLAAATGLAFLGAATALAGREWRRREPWWPLPAPPFLGAASLALSPGGCWGYAALALQYTIPTIYIVTVYTIARNYGFRPTSLRVAALLAPHVAALIAVALGSLQWPVLAALSMIVYPVAVGAYRLPRGRVAGVMRAALATHWLTAASGALLIAYAAARLYNGGVLDPAGLVHPVLLGSALAHVYLHFPLLAPQLLPLAVKPHTTPLPQALAFLAGTARLLGIGTLALLLLAASIAAFIVMAAPRPRFKALGRV